MQYDIIKKEIIRDYKKVENTYKYLKGKPYWVLDKLIRDPETPSDLWDEIKFIIDKIRSFVY